MSVSIEIFRKALENRGHQVFVYTLEVPGYEDTNPRVFRFKSVRIVKDPEVRQLKPWVGLTPIGHTSEEISSVKLDIVHAHTPSSMGILAKKFSKGQKIPIVYTHHADFPETIKFYWKDRIIFPRIARAYLKWFCNGVDAVIAPSLKIKKVLRRYGVKEAVPIHILPTGLDRSIFKKSIEGRAWIRKKLGIASDANVLIYTGRLGPEKNIKFLLKVFRGVKDRVDNAMLMIVGEGPSLRDLKQASKDLDLGKSVIFTGQIPYEEIHEYYSAANIFIFASFSEAQPLVIIEAMACGLPIVTLDEDSLHGIIEEGVSGFLVKNRSEKDFVNKTVKLLKDDEMYKRFSKSALELVADFSREKTAKKLEEIYKSLVKS